MNIAINTPCAADAAAAAAAALERIGNAGMRVAKRRLERVRDRGVGGEGGIINWPGA